MRLRKLIYAYKYSTLNRNQLRNWTTMRHETEAHTECIHQKENRRRNEKKEEEEARFEWIDFYSLETNK